MTDPAARRFRPTFWASITTVVALAILLGLGSWQLQRLSWKEQLIADVSEKTAGPPVALPAELSDPAIEFTLVQVEGRFQHEKELQLASRTHEGRVGSHVMTPFVLRDGRGLMIDRGWVPPERLDPETRADNRPVGQQRLEGYLRLGGWRGMAAFRPDGPALTPSCRTRDCSGRRESGVRRPTPSTHSRGDTRAATQPDSPRSTINSDVCSPAPWKKSTEPSTPIARRWSYSPSTSNSERLWPSC